jgi:hypothetical protein
MGWRNSLNWPDWEERRDKLFRSSLMIDPGTGRY